MKTIILSFSICIVLLILVLQSKAQDSLYNNRIYKAWIRTIDPSPKTKGVLFEVRDSTIVLSNSIYRIDYLQNNYTTSTYQVYNIRNIRLRKAKNIGKGVGIGFGVGVGVGLIVAAITVATEDNNTQMNTWDVSNDSHASEFIGIPILIGSLGAATGAVIGSLKVTIPINGNKNAYQEQRKRLKKYVLKKTK